MNYLCILIIYIFGILFIIIDIFGFINSIWTVIPIKIIFYIHFCFMCIIYILPLILCLLEKIGCSIDSIDYLIQINLFLFIFFYIFNIIKFISLSVNFVNYSKYLKNCPFTINDLDVNLHIEKRCDLYNINKNSRYSYQYICSYNPSKDLDFKLKKEIKNDNIICKNAKSIMNKEIIKLFFIEYKNIYYCSRTNIPKDYTYIKHKDCNNNNKYKWMIIIYTFSIFQIIYFPSCTLIIILMELPRASRLHRNNEIRRISFDSIMNFNNINNFIINELNNDSTRGNENINIEDNFFKQKTRNIIIENKKEFDIETNIKNFSLDKNNKKQNKINLDVLNINNINSENKVINNTENNINNQ